MAFLRTLTLTFWLTAAIATPVRDLSMDPLRESHCDWPGFDQDDDLDGVMVLYRGNKLAEWRNPTSQQEDWFGLNYQKGTSQHAQYSVTKTWIATLVGMLYRDGFLSWETEHPDKITLGDIFSDNEVWDEMWDIPYPFHGGSKVPELKAITLGELMSMRTGYSENGISSPFDSTLVRDLDRLVAWWHPLYRAGAIESQTCFNCAQYLASSGIVNYIIKEKTKTASNPNGWDPLDYARQTSLTLPNGNMGLFEALGMQRGTYTWDRDRDGIARAAFGLWADLEDMAKFGQLLLQGGKVISSGVEREIVPAYFLEEMTSTQSRISGVDLPYGWHVWNWGADDNGDSGFCAEGLGWQSICVFPKEEMVIAIQAPVSFGVETFASNIGFRNDAIKAIRDGVVCSPTAAPSTPSLPIFTPPPSITPPEIDEGDLVNDNPNEGSGELESGNNQNGLNKDDDSNLYFGKDIDESGVPVGLVVTLVLASVIICVLITLICCARRRKKKTEESSRSIDAMCKVIPDSSYDEANKVYDVALSDNESVDTEESDGITYFLEEDVEQQSSTKKTQE